MMCDDQKGSFLFSWKIKNIFNFPFFDGGCVTDSEDESDSSSDSDSEDEREDEPNLSLADKSLSIMFDVKSLVDSKWQLFLSCKKISDGKKQLVLQLKLHDYDENLINGKLDLQYEYELLDPDGNILIFSAVFNGTFVKGTRSKPYEIGFNDFLKRITHFSDDTIVIRCYMAKTNEEILSLKDDKSKVIDCEGETTCFVQVSKFICYSRFTSSINWTKSKKISGLSIPLEISFKYINDKIQIAIESNIEDDSQNLIAFMLVIYNEDDAEIFEDENQYNFNKNNLIWNYPKFISEESLGLGHSPSNKEIKMKFDFLLIFSNKVSYGGINQTKNAMQYTALTDAASFSHLQQNLCSLFTNKYFADVKLQADGEMFSAHKCLLAAASPVFLTMFQQDMKESITGTVDILDVDAKSLKSFLEFIYTGKITAMDEELALNLLVMADKYQVMSLEKKCSSFLMSIISSTIACKTLSIADLVNCDQLKMYAIDYIVENSKKILSSSEWSEWAKHNITLATDIILKLSHKFEINT